MEDEADTDSETAAAVERVRQGDEAAARLLVARLYPLVIRIVRSHRPRRTDEEDLAQMIFARLFNRLDQWRPTAPLEHWVSRLAVNVCLGQLAHERVRPELRMADLPVEQQELLERVMTEAGTPGTEPGPVDHELVRRLLESLPVPDRLVLQLLDIEGRSTREISGLTGWSQTLVKVRAFRARRKMRKLLEGLAEREKR